MEIKFAFSMGQRFQLIDHPKIRGKVTEMIRRRSGNWYIVSRYEDDGSENSDEFPEEDLKPVDAE